MAKGKKVTGNPVAVKPELFIASSAESVPVAHQLQSALQHYFTAIPWSAGVVRPSQSPIQSLEKELSKAKYAVFVFGKEDTVISRGKKQESVRDNVLIELGLFIGRLGSRRCFIVIPKNRRKLKIPSDLEGYLPIAYDDELFAKAPEAAAILVATDIRNALRDIGAEPVSAVPLAEAPIVVKPSMSGGIASLTEAIADLLGLFARGSAGVKVDTVDKAAVMVWSQTVLKNLLHVLTVQRGFR